MTSVQYPAPLFAANGGESALAVFLVSPDARILAMDSPYRSPETFSRPEHLNDVLLPYGEVDFAAWWQEVRSGCADQSDRDVVSFSFSGADHVPVTLSIKRVLDRDEYLVTCLPVGYRQLERLHVLQSIGVALSRLDLDGLLEAVRRQVDKLFNVTVFFVALYERDRDVVHFREMIEDGVPQQETLTLPFQDNLVGWVIRNRKSLMIGDIEQDPLPVTPTVIGVVPRSLIIVPMITHGDCVGALSVQHHEPNRFTEEDLWLLDAVAGQTAVAIHNAYLYEQTVSRLAVLASLQDLSVDLAAITTETDVVQVVAGAVLKLLHPDEVRIYLRPRKLRRLHCALVLTPEGALDLCKAAKPGHTVTLVDEHGAPFIAADAALHPGVVGDFDWSPASLAAYPIRRNGQRLGVILLLYRTHQHFTPDVLRTLSLITSRTAAAVERTHYHAELTGWLEQISALYTLAQKVTEQLNPDDILLLAVHTLREIFQARACVIALREGDDVVIRAAVGVKMHWQEAARFPLGEGITGRVVAEGKPISVPDIHTDPGALIFDPEVHSVIAVPIRYQGRVIGALNLDSTEIGAFDPEHERVLTIAAAQVAAALENARLYQAERDRSAKLAEANEELRHYEQLREELIQNLSHELRTPLTYIKGYVSLLQDGDMGDVTEEQVGALRIIDEKSTAIERLIRDVVTLEAITEETLHREIIDVNEMAVLAMDSLRTVVNTEALHLELALAETSCQIHADRSRINQVLDNLLGNAVKFTPEGGTIRLVVHTRPESGEAEFVISDSGIGIAPEYLDRIFERFFQVKDPASQAKDGSGIGLAIARRVIEAHGGRIWAESERGQGSTFHVVLPCIAAEDVGDERES